MLAEFPFLALCQFVLCRGRYSSRIVIRSICFSAVATIRIRIRIRGRLWYALIAASVIARAGIRPVRSIGTIASVAGISAPVTSISAPITRPAFAP